MSASSLEYIGGQLPEQIFFSESSCQKVAEPEKVKERQEILKLASEQINLLAPAINELKQEYIQKGSLSNSQVDEIQSFIGAVSGAKAITICDHLSKPYNQLVNTAKSLLSKIIQLNTDKSVTVAKCDDLFKRAIAFFEEGFKFEKSIEVKMKHAQQNHRFIIIPVRLNGVNVSSPQSSAHSTGEVEAYMRVGVSVAGVKMVTNNCIKGSLEGIRAAIQK